MSYSAEEYCAPEKYYDPSVRNAQKKMEHAALFYERSVLPGDYIYRMFIFFVSYTPE